MSSQNTPWLTNGCKQWLINGEKRDNESDVSQFQFNDIDDWSHINLPPLSNNEPLKGFSWKGGCKKVTNGILMWSKPFILTDPATKEKVNYLAEFYALFY